jgi:hypothetical protein
VVQPRVHPQAVDEAAVQQAVLERVLPQALAAVEPRVRLRAVLVVDVAARAPVVAVVAVEVAAVVLQLCRPLVRRDVEAFWLRGTPSLRKRRGADLQDPVQVLMPAVRLQLQETLCLRMSGIACWRLRRIRVNRFWTWQPEWVTLALP